MFVCILGTLSIIGTTMLYMSNVHSTVSEIASIKYEKWNSLCNMVFTQEQNLIIGYWKSIKLVLESTYLSILQYMNNSVTKIDPKTYDISYVINGRMYKIRVKPRKGPIPVLKIVRDDGTDLTSELLPYMGPGYDWYENSTPISHQFANAMRSRENSEECEQYHHVTVFLKDGKQYKI